MEIFTIEAMPSNEFRYKDISPTDILSLSNVDFKDRKERKEFYDFVLENTEVKVGEKWFPVRTPAKRVTDKDVYMPMGMEKDVIAMEAICTKFIVEVLQAAFSKSSE